MYHLGALLPEECGSSVPKANNPRSGKGQMAIPASGRTFCLKTSKHKDSPQLICRNIGRGPQQMLKYGVQFVEEDIRSATFWGITLPTA